MCCARIYLFLFSTPSQLKPVSAFSPPIGFVSFLLTVLCVLSRSEKKKYSSLCIHFSLSRTRSLSTFLNSWKLQHIALGIYISWFYIYMYFSFPRRTEISFSESLCLAVSDVWCLISDVNPQIKKLLPGAHEPPQYTSIVLFPLRKQIPKYLKFPPRGKLSLVRFSRLFLSQHPHTSYLIPGNTFNRLIHSSVHRSPSR